MLTRKLFSNLARDIRQKSNMIFQNKYQSIGISWSQLKRIRAADTNKINKINFKGSDLFYNGGNELLHAFDEIFLQSLYQFPKDKTSPYIIDCGAHIGISVLYFKLRFPLAEVVAFEPDEKNFSLLSSNTTSFKLKNVLLRQEAVWVENGSISFSAEGSMSSKIANAEQKSISIPAKRLFDLLTRQVDFLKIDIEGAEYEVLKDIAPRLDKVARLFVEYHGSFDQNKELNEMLSLINGAGFRYYLKEANPSYPSPFDRSGFKPAYDLQLNIFCIRD